MGKTSAVIGNVGSALCRSGKKLAQSEIAQEIKKESLERLADIGAEMSKEIAHKAIDGAAQYVGKKIGKQQPTTSDDTNTVSQEKLAETQMFSYDSERTRKINRLSSIASDYSAGNRRVAGARTARGVAEATKVACDITGVGAMMTGAVVPPIAPAAEMVAVTCDGVGLAAEGAKFFADRAAVGGKTMIANALDDAKLVTNLPSSDDILVEYTVNRAKFIRNCPLRDGEFGAIPINEKLMKELVSNASELGRGTLVDIGTLYFAYKAMSQSDREWVRSAFGYLTSDESLIPHSVPKLGYLDDRIVISYVAGRTKDTVSRVVSRNATELAETVLRMAENPVAERIDAADPMRDNVRNLNMF